MNACVLFHAVNGIGLGHVSRLTAIALALRERRPNLPLLFVVQGDSHGLLQSADLPYVAFPSASRFNGGEDSWLRSIRGRLLGSMAESIIVATNASLILFDCLPDPAFVAVAGRKSIPFAICVRKAKDMADYLRRLRPVLEQARIIIFPHESSEIEVPGEFIEKSIFVGKIVRPLNRVPDLTSQHDHSRIIISGGGGGYPGTVAFYNLALEALAKCRQMDPMLSATLVTGPLFDEWSQLRPTSGVQIIPFDPGITTRFGRANLVICQGGYNTIAELTTLGVPVICMPAERKFDDQYERAMKTAETYKQFHVWKGSDNGSLATLILKVLKMPATTTVWTPDKSSDGAGLAAQVLIEAMSS
ncbi:MAG TPA: glycosyltransferase [Pyrinomonadaceae bacterium]